MDNITAQGFTFMAVYLEYWLEVKMVPDVIKLNSLEYPFYSESWSYNSLMPWNFSAQMVSIRQMSRQVSRAQLASIRQMSRPVWHDSDIPSSWLEAGLQFLKDQKTESPSRFDLLEVAMRISRCFLGSLFLGGLWIPTFLFSAKRNYPNPTLLFSCLGLDLWASRPARPSQQIPQEENQMWGRVH